jgi:hypothetical protein
MSDDTQSLISDRRDKWLLLTPEQRSRRIQNAILRIIDVDRSQKRRRRQITAIKSPPKVRP